MGICFDFTPPAWWFTHKAQLEYANSLINRYCRNHATSNIPSALAYTYVKQCSRVLTALKENELCYKKSLSAATIDNAQTYIDQFLEFLYMYRLDGHYKLSGIVQIGDLHAVYRLVKDVFYEMYVQKYFNAMLDAYYEGISCDECGKNPEEDCTRGCHPDIEFDDSEIEDALIGECNRFWRSNETAVYASVCFGGWDRGHVPFGVLDNNIVESDCELDSTFFKMAK